MTQTDIWLLALLRRSGSMVVLEGVGLEGGAVPSVHTQPDHSSQGEALGLLKGERKHCVLQRFSGCMSVEFLIHGTNSSSGILCKCPVCEIEEQSCPGRGWAWGATMRGLEPSSPFFLPT